MTLATVIISVYCLIFIILCIGAPFAMVGYNPVGWLSAVVFLILVLTVLLFFA